MITAVSNAMDTVIGWVGTVITALLPEGTLNGLLPLFAIGIAISALLLGIKIIKSVVWGA